MIEERNICYRNNFQPRYNQLNKCIRKRASRDRDEFILNMIDIKDWVGVMMNLPFVPKPLKIEDLDGRERPIQERAAVLASYYEKRQWHTAPLPPLPPRPLLFPVADELPTGPFTP